MTRTVQIMGMAPNIGASPLVPGAERWCGNWHRSYRIKFPEVLVLPPFEGGWTRWINVHSIRHITLAYGKGGWLWYQQQDRPIYLQEAHPDVPASLTFPRHAIQAYFSRDGTPLRYFTCSLCWYIAFAIMEGFGRIELCGFEMKRDRQYDFERPGASWWVEEARRRGIEVTLPAGVDFGTPGDPDVYTGPLYGYEPHSDAYRRTF